MEAAEPRLVDSESDLASLAHDRANQPPDLRVQKEIGDYYVELTPAGEDLVISFENADDSNPEPFRFPWGYKYLRELDVAVLGVKTKRSDWYRGRELQAFFQSDDFHRLLGAYRKVLFYGSSMGGFAALTFATPGSLVLAHNPQTNLDPALTPWDTRFPEAHQQDWSGPFAMAADGARQAARAIVTYDPFLEVDRRHVERLDPANLVALKAPFLGHALPSYFRRMGILAELVPLALSGGLTREWWYPTIRKRRQLARYHLLMSERISDQDSVARLLARAFKLSSEERRTQDRIRRYANTLKLGELFERYLDYEPGGPKGPQGPDADLFRQFMEGHG